MTDRLDDVAGYGALASRWHALAEQRLEYLTELFESDRWRRYYSERSFLQNLQEAKAAVETWRKLSVGGATASAAVATEASKTSSDDAASAAEVELPPLELALKVIEEPVLDLAAMQQRYPLLRNTL
jgi:uncharacterized repeat protein (TIGR03809 family)